MATSLELTDSGDAPALDSNFAYRAAVTLCGASQATATVKMAPITDEAVVTVYHLPAGNTVLTPALMRYDILVSDNPGSTSVEVPENATLGWTYVTGQEPSFFVQRRGAGILAVNFTGDATLVEDNNLDPATLGPYHRPVRVSSPSTEDEWIFD